MNHEGIWWYALRFWGALRILFLSAISLSETFLDKYRSESFLTILLSSDIIHQNVRHYDVSHIAIPPEETEFRDRRTQKTWTA